MNALATIRRVPFFYYLLHLYVIHAIAVGKRQLRSRLDVQHNRFRDSSVVGSLRIRWIPTIASELARIGRSFFDAHAIAPERDPHRSASRRPSDRRTFRF
jgi:hypothetical protein